MNADQMKIAEINSCGPFVHGHYSHPVFGKISQEGPLKGRADLLLESALSILQSHMKSTNKSPDEIAIIDVGAYDGWILNRLYQLGFTKSTGIEPGKQNIERGIRVRELLGIEDKVKHYEGTLDTPGILQGEKFDVVLCFGVIHHINDINLFISQLNSRLVDGGRMLLETLCLSDSLVTDQFREYMEPKDLIYNGKELEVGIIGVKLESAYYPGSTDTTGTVQIPSEKSLRWFLEFNKFSINSFKNGWETISIGEKLSNSHRKNATSCLIDLTKLSLGRSIQQINPATSAEEIATFGLIEIEILAQLESVCEKHPNSYNIFLASRIQELEKRSKYPDLVNSIIHAPKTKLKFELAKYQLATGNRDAGVEILKSIVLEICDDWRTAYRAFFLLSMFDTNSEFNWKEMALRCNPEFPYHGKEIEFMERFG